MSSNNFFLIEDDISLFVYFGLAKLFKEKLLSKSTLEGTIQHEAKLLDYVRIIENTSLDQMIYVDEKDELLVENYGFNITVLNRKLIHIYNLLNYIDERLFKEIYEINFLLESIKGKVRRINQKKSALNLWKENVVYLHLENFSNVDYLSVESNSLNFNHDMAVCTLPIQSEDVVVIKSMYISGGNGTPGNSDLAVESNTQNLENLLSKSDTSYFEYEKLDSGPLFLEVTFELSRQSILNCLDITPFLDEENLGYEIEDVLFHKKDNKSLSIKSLCKSSSFYLGKDAGEVYTLSFLPVRCDSFSIKFRQEDSSETSKERRLRLRRRKRFSIALKRVAVKSIKYKKEGSCFSKSVPLDMEVFAGEGEFEVFPRQADLYKEVAGVYCEGRWKDLKREDSTFLLSGNEKYFKWRYSLERKDLDFKNKSSYEDNLSELIYKTKMVSKRVNPCNMTFDGEVKEENISVFCDSSLNRTSSNKKYKTLKYIKSDTMRFNIMVDGIQATPDGLHIKVDIPISLKNLRIEKEDLGISINNVDYEQVEALEHLDNGNYFMSYSDNSIVFLKDTFPSRGRVRWWLRPEQLRFFSKSNYVYSKFDFFFSPNKQRIEIYYLSSLRKSGHFSLRPGKKRFFLGKNGIEKNTISISSSIGFTEVSSLLDLLNYSGSGYAYHFDEKSSVLHLNDFLDRGSLAKVNFFYREKKKLEDSEYEIWEKDSIPTGIKILKEDFKSETVTQKLYSPNKEIFSNIENVSLTRSKTLDNSTISGTEQKAFELSYENILMGSFVIDRNILENPYDKPFKEKDFIDGNTEFLGLSHIEDEFTNEILSSIGTVSFSVGARSLFYKKAGIIFEDEGEYFPPSQEKGAAVDVVSIGDWFISDDGDVTVYIGAGNRLPRNIRYSYYYKKNNDQNQGNFFSVDYGNSIIYFSGAVLQSESASIKYNVSNYIAEYDILKKVKDYKVDFSNKKVEINSSEFLLNRGDCFLFYKKNLFSYNLEEVREYFSPLLYSARFKFR